MAQSAGRANGNARRILGWFAALALAGALGACGGGGSDLADNRVTLPVGGGGTPGTGSGGTGSGGSGGTPTPALAALVLSILDQASGQAQSTISYTGLSVAKAVVTDGQGLPVPNAVVSFSASNESAIVFSPAATALTDATGTAQVNVKPASLTTAGAYTIRAAAEVGAQLAQSTFNVAIGAPAVELGTLVAGQSPLSAYGTTVLTVPVVGVPASTPITVRFTSTCAEQTPARATIGALVTTVNGVARTTYVDRGCASNDLVTATVEGTGVTRTGNLQVAAPAIANIQFVSAAPYVIAQRGVGGTQGPGTGLPFPEIATVRFQVVDQAGTPVPTPTNVTLRLSNNTGGILIDQVPGPVIKQTDANGIVEVQVQSGTVPTPVWVIASIAAGTTTLTTNSVQLAVSTGQPIQNRFSLSSLIYNCEGWSYDGFCTDLLLIAGDAMGNPVPDGTGISFISDAGVVEANCQTGVATGRPLPGDGEPGRCGVQLLSAGVRPPNGRFLVAAYAVGEEFYQDLNGNNRYDVGEPFFDQGHLFIDRNRNGTYEQGERFVPYLAQSAACGANPLTQSVPNTCDGAWGLAHVRNVLGEIVLSGSFGYLRTSQTFATPNVSNIPTSYQLDPNTCTVQIPFWLQDLNGNPMPYDTRLVALVASSDGLTASVAGDIIASTNAIGGTFHRVIATGRRDAGVCSGSGTVTVRIATPRNNVTAFEVSVSPSP